MPNEDKKLELFRANALNNLNSVSVSASDSPVIGLGAWLWVTVASLLLSATVIWGMLGQLTVTVTGSGMILPVGGHIVSVLGMSLASVTDVYVNAGMKVKRGDVLATVFNPSLDENFNFIKSTYIANQRLLAEYKQQYASNRIRLITQFHARVRFDREQIIAQQKKVDFMKYIVSRKKILFDKHFLTVIELEQAKEEYRSAMQLLNKITLDTTDASLKFKQALTELDETMHQRELKYQAIEHEFKLKMLEKNREEKMISPIDGEVVACHIVKGSVIKPDQVVFTLMTAPANRAVEALMFVNHTDGKRIAIGMPTHILPDTANRFDDAYIKGKVYAISEYPVSKEFAYDYLGNMSLVDEYFANGAPFIAKIRLSQSRKIKPGTLLTGKIMTKTCSPVALYFHTCYAHH